MKSLPLADYNDITEKLDDLFAADVLEVAGLEMLADMQEPGFPDRIFTEMEVTQREDAMQNWTICLAYWTGYKADFRRAAKGLDPEESGQ
jgi:hypothetical protein